MVERLLRPLPVLPALELALVAPGHAVWAESELLALRLVGGCILFAVEAHGRRLLDGDEFVHDYYVHSRISRREPLKFKRT